MPVLIESFEIDVCCWSLLGVLESSAPGYPRMIFVGGYLPMCLFFAVVGLRHFLSNRIQSVLLS